MSNLLGVVFKAVAGREEPLVRNDRGPTNVSLGLEVKTDLPGPLSKFSILPTNDAIELVGPDATICVSTENPITKGSAGEKNARIDQLQREIYGIYSSYRRLL